MSGQIDFRSLRDALPLHDLIAAHIQVARSGPNWTACCPFHQDSTPSFTIFPDQRFFCFGCGASGDGVDFLRGYHGISVREAVKLVSGRAALPVSPPLSPAQPYARQDEAGEAERIAWALARWAQARPILGTLAEVYLVQDRGLPAEVLAGREHCLGWDRRRGEMLALMVNPVSDTPCGIHRFHLDDQGHKLSRKMLGKAAVVPLSASSETTEGLGITEGVEDGLAVLASGWAPIWACATAGGIERFPILAGIEALTIFADPDPTGMQAAETCARRWRAAGREVAINTKKKGM
ncbi:CHC2 zinc finger domain-containing protein [Inquilinus sp. CA228]|uniref:CHC2 zinc finger domain-containing protein n=1 Tax=Inquilinus sp. CA228 TaxID=3455609 RepID=UPI003F8CFB2B